MKTKKAFLTILISALGVLNAHSQLPSYVPTNGLNGYWPFNGNANDESGNGNNGTVYGSAQLTSDRSGVSGSAYNFDGVNDYIKCLNAGPGGNPTVTVSFWMKRQNNLNGHIFGYGNNGINGKDFRIYVGSSYCSAGSIAFDNYGSAKTISDNQTNSWEFYTIVYDGNLGVNTTVAKIYKNNILINTICYSVNIANTNISTLIPITFGRYHGTIQTAYFTGQLDDFGIWNRALTQQEITSLYNGCIDETATTNSLNVIILKNAQPINLTASPSLDGQFSGDAITNNQFIPANAHLGKNTVHYNFTNSSGCKDSTDFSVIVYDTLGNVCSAYDTLKIKVKFTAGLYANTINTIKFYPNPTKDVLFIDNGNYQAMNGYSIKIVSLAGTVVYNQPITSQQVQISMNQFATKGLYIAQIIDSNNAIVDSKKIVLE